MRPSTLQTFTRTAQSSLKPSLSYLPRAKMSTSTNPPSIEATNIQTGPGVELSSHQRTVIGSVLDLFAGRPSKEKLQLWRDDATFADQITIAEGRKQYEAQWYGLQSAMSSIERLHYVVKDAGNPMLMDLKTKYVVKGVGMEKVIESVVAVYLDGEGKVEKVEDRWGGSLPDSKVADALRKVNANTVPWFAGPPKNE